MNARSPEPLVLMYHGLDPGDGRYAGTDPGVMAYVIARETFVGHLRALTDAGRRIVSPSEVAAPDMEPGDVILTFDDGMQSDYDCAFPLLRAEGCGAFFFITTAEVGRPGRVDWQQLREMAGAGMQIGSHGHTHRFFSAMTEEEQREELRTSRKLLEENTGATVRTLSLPGGRTGRHTLRLARECGYETVFTSEPETVRRKDGTVLVGRIAVRAPWTAAYLQDFLTNQARHLRRMRLAHSMRRMAQICLGEGFYVCLHRAVWAIRGK